MKHGVMCVIQGTSGSGKSTMLNCIGGLDVVDSGSIKIDGKEIVGLKAGSFRNTAGMHWDSSSSFTIWYRILLSGKVSGWKLLRCPYRKLYHHTNRENDR